MPIAELTPGIHAHVGMVTCDLDAAIAHLGPLLGLRFTDQFDGALAPPFATADGAPAPGLARVCTSVGGPMRIELLEGMPGSVWHTTEIARMHHVAYWVDDVTTTAEALMAAGWELEVTLATDARRPVGFAYLTRRGHARIELTDGSDLPAVLRPLEWAHHAEHLR